MGEIDTIEGAEAPSLNTVPNIPFWMSQANTEATGVGTGWISNSMSIAGKAVPGWVSQMGGWSAWTPTHTFTIAEQGNPNTHACGWENGWSGWGASGALNPPSINGMGIISFLDSEYMGAHTGYILLDNYYATSPIYVQFPNMQTFTFTFDGTLASSGSNDPVGLGNLIHSYFGQTIGLRIWQ